MSLIILYNTDILFFSQFFSCFNQATMGVYVKYLDKMHSPSQITKMLCPRSSLHSTLLSSLHTVPLLCWRRPTLDLGYFVYTDVVILPVGNFRFTSTLSSSEEGQGCHIIARSSSHPDVTLLSHLQDNPACTEARCLKLWSFCSTKVNADTLGFAHREWTVYTSSTVTNFTHWADDENLHPVDPIL